MEMAPCPGAVPGGRALVVGLWVWCLRVLPARLVLHVLENPPRSGCGCCALNTRGAAASACHRSRVTGSLSADLAPSSLLSVTNVVGSSAWLNGTAVARPWVTGGTPLPTAPFCERGPRGGTASARELWLHSPRVSRCWLFPGVPLLALPDGSAQRRGDAPVSAAGAEPRGGR